MSRKNLLVSLATLCLFTVLTALLWRQHFASMPPLLRDLMGGEQDPSIHVMGDSPQKDAIAIRQMAAAAERGDPGAQFLHALTLEPLDMKEALRWHRAAADQGHEMAFARLKEIEALEASRAQDAQAPGGQPAGS